MAAGSNGDPKKRIWQVISSKRTPLETEKETVEKPSFERLMENVHMQGFRNWGPARRVGNPSEARTNPEE
jgi:hypothetical protein